MDDEPICESGTTNCCWNAKIRLFQRQSKLFLRCESSDKIYQATKEVSYHNWEEYCQVLCDHKEYKAILLMPECYMRMETSLDLKNMKMDSSYSIRISPDPNTSSYLTTDELIWQQLNE